MPTGAIQLRGVEVHNLQQVDLDIPHGRLVVLCGVSGSGKTSLALDTLYAEGQRRYIESFSAYTRQFLERLEKPAAERIDGLPPAIAVTHSGTSRSSRTTVGTATEVYEYLRLLYARIGRVICYDCGQQVRRDSPEAAARRLEQLPAGTRFMVTFPRPLHAGEDAADVTAQLQEEGFVRAIAGNAVVQLAESSPPAEGNGQPLFVVVDRLAAGTVNESRLRESVETAYDYGEGRCYAFVADGENAAQPAGKGQREIDGRHWQRLGFSSDLVCEDCGLEYPSQEPKLFSFNSPLGACPTCEGFGNVIDIDMDLVVPDPNKTLAEGAIAPWNTPAYSHELEELLRLAGDYDLPVDVPYRELTDQHRRLIVEGVPQREFGGLNGFFKWLERRKYKMHLRVFLSRWRSYNLCPDCRGDRLRPEALATKVGGLSIAEVCQLQISDALQFFAGKAGQAASLPSTPDERIINPSQHGESKYDAAGSRPGPLALSDHERRIARIMLDQITARLAYLSAVGLDYLTLDRTLRTLSGGEAQRVALTSALGSSLVNMLYVLDEPTVGLHPRDVGQLVEAIESLRERGNTVVVVEHEEAMIRAADQVIEFGPGAGSAGGQVVFQGTPQDMIASDSLTGEYLAGRRGVSIPTRRPDKQGRLKLTGARGNNLKNITVEFPLGLLCLVTGVSGSGKSTLVQDTLYPALCRRKRKDGAPKPLPHDDIFGDGQIDEVILVDQSPIGRSPRSNPVTYIKAFDAIRDVFADTLQARTHNYTASHFSFNVDGGRCTACGGDGCQQIDMQFMADVYVKCPVCGGTRYRREILQATYRDRNIHQVLQMTVREAFGFFRGQAKVQSRLKPLLDVGLEYLQLGQPASTLSSGEAQRLKLASFLGGSHRGRTLFILDEPTTGLHFNDVVHLLDCFETLLSVGHSLIVVEHNLQMMKAADWIIDLGPAAANQGGTIVAEGTPEQLAAHRDSPTGHALRETLSIPADK